MTIRLLDACKFIPAVLHSCLNTTESLHNIIHLCIVDWSEIEVVLGRQLSALQCTIALDIILRLHDLKYLHTLWGVATTNLQELRHSSCCKTALR